MMLLRTFLLWLLILLFAIANGTLREAVLIPALGKPLGLAASGLLLSLVILAVAFLFVPRLVTRTGARPQWVGLAWLTLTIAFEFGFGLLVQGHGWTELLEAYTFKDGNLWPLVLLVTLIAPALAMRRARQRLRSVSLKK